MHPLLWQSAPAHPIKDLHNPLAAPSQQLHSGYAKPSILLGCCNPSVPNGFSAASFYIGFPAIKTFLLPLVHFHEKKKHTEILAQIDLYSNFPFHFFLILSLHF